MSLRAVEGDGTTGKSESPDSQASKAVALMRRPETLTPEEFLQLEQNVLGGLRGERIDPNLLASYGRLCLQSGQPAKAIAMCKSATEFHPEYNLEYAQICKMAGSTYYEEMLQAARAAEVVFNVKLGTPAETEADRIGLARSLVLLGENEMAIEVLEKGRSDDPVEHSSIRQALAEMYIEAFRRENADLRAKTKIASVTGVKKTTTAEVQADSPILDWSYLHKAAKLDRNSPNLAMEIAVLWRQSFEPPGNLLKVLTDQLQYDFANLSTRAMVAEIHLIHGQLVEAKKEWEKILGKDPNNIPALNNLSVVLSRETPLQFDRAIEMIDRAYRISPKNAEICDSYGEVFMNAGQSEDAIGKLEEAIRLDPNRIGTRKRLAACYRELGEISKAVQQEKQAENIKANDTSR